jgi:hypothetical protein
MPPPSSPAPSSNETQVEKNTGGGQAAWFPPMIQYDQGSKGLNCHGLDWVGRWQLTLWGMCAALCLWEQRLTLSAWHVMPPLLQGQHQGWQSTNHGAGQTVAPAHAAYKKGNCVLIIWERKLLGEMDITFLDLLADFLKPLGSLPCAVLLCLALGPTSLPQV